MLLGLAASWVGVASVAHAASTDYWVPGGNGNWSSSTNWAGSSGGGSGRTVSSGDKPTFDFNSGVGTVNTTYDFSTAGFDLLGLQEYAGVSTVETFPNVVVNADSNNDAMTFTGNPPLQNESNAMLTINTPVNFTGSVGVRVGAQTSGSTLVGATPGVIVLNGPRSLGGNMSVLGDAAPGSNTNPYGNLVINGNISGSGDSVSVENGYSASNYGYVELGGANTFTGGVTIDHAMLVVDNGTNGSATGSGTVTMAANDSAIGGTGTISGPITPKGGISITAGGFLDPIANPAGGYRNFVNSTGLLTLQSGLQLAVGSANYVVTMNFDVNGSAASQLAITGGTFAPSYGDTINISAGSKFTKSSYDLIDYAGSTVNFGNYASLGALVNTWTLNGAPTGWHLYNDAANNSIGIEAVPEPTTLGLFAGGVARCCWQAENVRCGFNSSVMLTHCHGESCHDIVLATVWAGASGFGM